ncbi:MAG: AmmeMemoRadiSam system radical SAM enzyme [Candidatus Aenigmarchaeota archaeon]|nr:AmmeMemoRadiSam system radical SAM enzyme [Candidatus Aenigmarchaeota archaeon]
MKEAMFYEAAKKETVNCRLCARRCKRIKPGKTGFCGVRKNVDGKLYSLVYGKACSAAADPIEKKPLFHFAPGTMCLSIATVGCNFRCLHCQNWEISQGYGEIDGKDLEPEKVVGLAKGQGMKGIAYTYTEPTVFYEYAYDTMRLARKAGLYNVWVSNGYTTPEAIKHMSKLLDAVNVDVKGNDEFYKKVCKTPGLQPVYDALLAYKEAGVWVEVTNLVIPGYNDNEKDIRGIVRWLHDNMGPDTPLHFSAFFPNFKLTNVGPTPPKTLEKAYGIAKDAGMRWVYLGNVPGSAYESTACPRCGKVIIKRIGYTIAKYGDRCKECGVKVPIAGAKWL